jgi:hypothetical protein
MGRALAILAKPSLSIAAILWLSFNATVFAQTAPSIPQVVNRVRPSVVQIVTRQIAYDTLVQIRS